jgi:hypothetical protein
MPYVVPSAAAVTICPNSNTIRSWCREMCSGLYDIKRAQTRVPTYVVYFTSRVDCQMFEHAFSADMWLASDLLPL